MAPHFASDLVEIERGLGNETSVKKDLLFMFFNLFRQTVSSGRVNGARLSDLGFRDVFAFPKARPHDVESHENVPERRLALL